MIWEFHLNWEVLDKIKERAKTDVKTIVLAEGEDIRTIEAADIILPKELQTL